MEMAAIMRCAAVLCRYVFHQLDSLCHSVCRQLEIFFLHTHERIFFAHGMLSGDDFEGVNDGGVDRKPQEDEKE